MELLHNPHTPETLARMNEGIQLDLGLQVLRFLLPLLFFVFLNLVFDVSDGVLFEQGVSACYHRRPTRREMTECWERKGDLFPRSHDGLSSTSD